MADNTILAFPNYVAGTVVATPSIDAFGSWEADLPAANILDPLLSVVARSTDAATASTKLQVNLGVDRTFRVIAIPSSNISLNGQIKATWFSDAAYSVEVGTTGWVDYWEDAYEWGVRPWGTPDLFSNKFSAEDVAGYPAVWAYLAANLETARYFQIEVDDTGNADGYVEFGRLVIAPVWQSTIAPIEGQSSISWESRSRLRRSRTGVWFIDSKAAPRVATCSFQHIATAEAFTYPFEMARLLDRGGEVFFITDTTDTFQRMRRWFLANLRTLPDLTYTNGGRMSATIELEEIL